ncbi:MAG: hypothetical protein WCF90_07510 [Methanomicrobiales archaeon]
MEAYGQSYTAYTKDESHVTLKFAKVVLGDTERGIALVKTDALQELACRILNSTSKPEG